MPAVERCMSETMAYYDRVVYGPGGPGCAGCRHRLGAQKWQKAVAWRSSAHAHVRQNQRPVAQDEQVQDVLPVEMVEEETGAHMQGLQARQELLMDLLNSRNVHHLHVPP